MKITQKQVAYIGIGVFFLLILLNSSKKIALNEVSEQKPNTLSFDHSSLPINLQPPSRLAENEPLPQNNIRKTNLNGINFMPRFE
jgi:hypothetical protein